MKLLINTDLTYTQLFTDFSPEDKEAFIEEVYYWKALCSRFSVQAKFSIEDECVKITVFVQKCTLDEFAMNELFHEVIDPLFEYEVQYAALGGAGCDFAITIETKKTLNSVLPSPQKL